MIRILLLQVVTDESFLAYYIAKYISKAEPVYVRTEVSAGIQHANTVESETVKSKVQRKLSEIMRKREVR